MNLTITNKKSTDLGYISKYTSIYEALKNLKNKEVLRVDANEGENINSIAISVRTHISREHLKFRVRIKKGIVYITRK